MFEFSRFAYGSGHCVPPADISLAKHLSSSASLWLSTVTDTQVFLSRTDHHQPRGGLISFSVQISAMRTLAYLFIPSRLHTSSSFPAFDRPAVNAAISLHCAGTPSSKIQKAWPESMRCEPNLGYYSSNTTSPIPTIVLTHPIIASFQALHGVEIRKTPTVYSTISHCHLPQTALRTLAKEDVSTGPRVTMANTFSRSRA